MSAESLQLPPAVLPGDGVSIVAPASSPDRATLDAAIEGLKGAGLHPKVYRDLGSPVGYLSGTDEQRAAELNQALADPETTFILAARGGNGVGRILDRIDFGLLSERPKAVCGYSDITALHAAIQRECGLVSFHGPNLVDGLGDGRVETMREASETFAMLAGHLNTGCSLIDAGGLGPEFATALMQGQAPEGLEQTAEEFDRDPPQTLVGGVAEGRLVGGNLAVLVSMLGTPWEPDFDGAILVIEDVGEAPYRIDRLLNQLRLAGRLGKLRGVVAGYFTGCDADGPPSADEVLAEYLAPLGVPTVIGAPFGHEHPNLPLPLGLAARLDADAGTLATLAPVVAERA